MVQVFPAGASRNNTPEHTNLLLCSRASYTGYVVDWENGWGRGAHKRRGEESKRLFLVQVPALKQLETKREKIEKMVESSEVASSKQTDVLSSCRGDDMTARIHGGGEAIRRSQPLKHNNQSNIMDKMNYAGIPAEALEENRIET